MENIESITTESGIYCFTNKINGHKYVGQSKNIKKRVLYHHFCDYKAENQKNNCPQLYQAFNKYGLDNFRFDILEICEIDELDKKEIYWINKLDSYHNGYNATMGGQNWNENIHSQETELKRQQTRELNQSLKSEKHPRAKLTNQQVVSIRQRYINGEAISNIYEDFKTYYDNPKCFERVVIGETYVSAGNIPTKEDKENNLILNKKKISGKKSLTDEQVKEIRQKYENNNISYATLGYEYNVSSGTIRNIIVGKTYTSVQ